MEFRFGIHYTNFPQPFLTVVCEAVKDICKVQLVKDMSRDMTKRFIFLKKETSN